MFKAIQEFTDHPSLKEKDACKIYFFGGKFYLAASLYLAVIKLDRLDPTNLGEPYRDFASLYFFKEGMGGASYCMDIGTLDAARLWEFCSKEQIGLRISKELSTNSKFAENLTRLIADQLADPA